MAPARHNHGVNSAPTSLVLLDLDGTLMDSAPGIVASAAEAYRTLGLPVPDAATLRSFVGPPITDSFPRHGVPVERLTEMVRAYRTVFAAGGSFFPDFAVFGAGGGGVLATGSGGRSAVFTGSTTTAFSLCFSVVGAGGGVVG